MYHRRIGMFLWWQYQTFLSMNVLRSLSGPRLEKKQLKDELENKVKMYKTKG